MSRMLLSTTALGGLVTWKPTHSRQPTRVVPFPCQIVSIQSLEPDGIVPTESLLAGPVASIESLLAAPVVSISSLAPDVLMAVA